MRARSDAGSSLFSEATSRMTESSRLRDSCLAREPLGRRAAFAEQLLEEHLRIVFHRQRQSRSLPGDRIRVGASVAGAAVQTVLFDRQFHRGQRRVLAESLRHNLIDRSADVNAFLFRMSAAQKHRGRARMIRSGVAADCRRPEDARGC